MSQAGEWDDQVEQSSYHSEDYSIPDPSSYMWGLRHSDLESDAGSCTNQYKRHGKNALRFAMERWAARDKTLYGKPPVWFMHLYGASPWMFRVHLNKKIFKYLTLLVRMNWYLLRSSSPGRCPSARVLLQRYSSLSGTCSAQSIPVGALPRMLRTTARRFIRSP